MRARTLHPDEWECLEHSDLSALLPHVRPEDFEAVVVEDDAGSVVGTLGLVRAAHYEGLWIAPEHRANPAVARLLLREARRMLERERWVFAFAASDEMKGLVPRLGGQQLPVESYVIAKGV